MRTRAPAAPPHCFEPSSAAICDACGGWIAASALMELMTTVGVSQTRTRTAILRVRSKGLLDPDDAGWQAPVTRCEPTAIPALARGDRRIYSARQMDPSDRWCLISYSIPESQRQLRHQLRRRLSGIGCGTVSAALWICPNISPAEVEDILADLGVRASAAIFLADETRVAGGLERAVGQWWDLPAIAARHQSVPVRVRICGGCRPHPRAGVSRPGSDASTPGGSSRTSTPACLPRGLPADWPGNLSIPPLRRSSGATRRSQRPLCTARDVRSRRLSVDAGI